MSQRRGTGRYPTRQSVRSRPVSGGIPPQPSMGRGRGQAWEQQTYGAPRHGPPGFVMDMDPGLDDPEVPVKRHKFKNCCRSFATFMFTQVGVGGIIVGYAIMGAFGFIAIETQEGNVADRTLGEVNMSRIRTARQLFRDYNRYMFNDTLYFRATNETLFNFQEFIVKSVKENGYDGRNVEDQWNFPASLMFTLSIFTMIGYGNLVPRTQWGKVITIAYAIFGIPLYILYFMNMGKALASAFKWLYIKLNNMGKKDELEIRPNADFRSSRKAGIEHDPNLLVPSSASLYVLISYIGVGTIMFAEWERWDYLDSVYFCVTSLCKIGLGDFVPGTSLDDSHEGSQTKLIINFIYLLLGLGLVAMCYNLLKEEVLAKIKSMKNDLRDLCFFLRNECNCCK